MKALLLILGFCITPPIAEAATPANQLDNYMAQVRLLSLADACGQIPIIHGAQDAIDRLRPRPLSPIEATMVGLSQTLGGMDAKRTPSACNYIQDSKPIQAWIYKVVTQ